MRYLTSFSLKVFNSSLKCGVMDSLLAKVKLHQFPGSIENCSIALTLPVFNVERAVHIGDISAMAHHRDFAVFAFFNNSFHAYIISPSMPNISKKCARK